MAVTRISFVECAIQNPAYRLHWHIEGASGENRRAPHQFSGMRHARLLLAYDEATR
jgi:hypothetical protein